MLAQAGFVGWPVRHSTPHPQDVTATVLVQLERHRELQGPGEETSFYFAQLLSINQPIPAPR